MSSTSTAYRADIDGLRALAVLSVAIFYLYSSWMPSGFLGVDIFFVLSGFLISTILYREISTGAFLLDYDYDPSLNQVRVRNAMTSWGRV